MRKVLMWLGLTAVLGGSLVILRAGEQDLGTVLTSSESAEASILLSRARDVMFRPDRPLFLAEVCAARESSIEPVRDSKAVPPFGPTDMAQLRDGYGITEEPSGKSDRHSQTIEPSVDGVGISSIGVRELAVDSPSAPERWAIREAAIRAHGQDDCVDQNVREQQAIDLTNAFGSLTKRLVDEVRADSAVVGAWEGWTTCMVERGFDFESRIEIIRELTAERDLIGYVVEDSASVAQHDAALVAAADRERQIGAADADCYSEHVHAAEGVATSTALQGLTQSDLELVRRAAALGD